MTTPSPAKSRSLLRLLDLGRRRRTAVVAGASALLLVAAVLVARVQFRGDVLDLVPQSSRAVRSFRVFVESFGGLDELYVIFEAPEGAEVSEYGGLVRRFVAALEQAPEIESVDASLLDLEKDWSYLFDRVLLLLGESAAEEQLLELTPERMEAALRRARADMSFSSPGAQALVRADPFGMTRALRARFAASKSFVSFDPLAEGYVSRDRRMRLVIAKPVSPPFDAAFCRRLMERLESIRSESLRSWRRDIDDDIDDGSEIPVADPRIDFAGAYRVSLEAETLIRREMWRNALVSLFLILLVVFVWFRSTWILLCATLVLGLSGLLAMVSVGLWRGGLLAAASGGAAMLFGLGIDGVMVLYARHLELRDDPAPDRLVGTAAAVVLGNVTSVATFAALAWIDFPSLEEFGRLVGLGMLYCCLFTLLLVPAFWSFHAAARRGTLPATPRWPWLARFVTTRPRVILGAAVAFSLISVVGVTRFDVRTNVEQLRPSTPGNDVTDALRERFGFPEDVLLVVATGPELDPLLELHRDLEAALLGDPDVPSLVGPTLFLPPAADQQSVRTLIERSGLERQALRSRLEAAAERAGFRPGVFEPFVERLDRLLDRDAAITYEGLAEHGLGSLAGRYVAHDGRRFVTATHLYPGAGVDPATVVRKVREVSPDLETTGLALVNAEVAEAFPRQLFRGLLLGGLAVFGLVYLGFKSFRLSVISLAPTALGLLWSVGTLAHIGYRFDLIGAFAFIMVIGIGVDYGIHVLERYGADGSVGAFLPFTGAAIGLAALTTVLGFGTLLLSSYAPLSSLGLVTLVSVVAVAVTSLVVLPAWLEVFRP